MVVTRVESLLKQAYKFYEKGDYSGASRVHAEAVKIEPKLRSQSYFWTEEWLAGEREASDDIAAGRVRSFNNIDSLFNYLRG